MAKKPKKLLRTVNLEEGVLRNSLKAAEKDSRSFSSYVNFVLKNHAKKLTRK